MNEEPKSNFLRTAPQGVDLLCVMRSYMFLDALDRIENSGPREVAVGYWKAWQTCHEKGWGYV